MLIFNQLHALIQYVGWLLPSYVSHITWRLLCHKVSEGIISLHLFLCKIFIPIVLTLEKWDTFASLWYRLSHSTMMTGGSNRYRARHFPLEPDSFAMKAANMASFSFPKPFSSRLFRLQIQIWLSKWTFLIRCLMRLWMLIHQPLHIVPLCEQNWLFISNSYIEV